MPKSDDRHERGFTLLEVMVALVIATLGLTALYRTASEGLGAAATATRYVEATNRARSMLAATGVSTPLGIGTTAGVDGPFRWRVEITPAGAAAADDVDEPDLPKSSGRPLYAVHVTVGWATARAVSLSTFRLGPARESAP